MELSGSSDVGGILGGILNNAAAGGRSSLTLKRLHDRESALRKLFVSAAADESAAVAEETVDAFALNELLQQAFKKEPWFIKFSVETSKMLLALVDDDFAGKIDYEQFTQLWATVLKAKVSQYHYV